MSAGRAAPPLLAQPIGQVHRTVGRSAWGEGWAGPGARRVLIAWQEQLGHLIEG
jgi:hypothetical protein